MTPGIRHIVVFLQNRNHFGALICHIPLLHALRCQNPSAQLTVVAPFREAGLLVGEGLADQMLLWPPSVRARYRLCRELDADLFVNLRPASMFIDLLTGLSGARLRVGY